LTARDEAIYWLSHLHSPLPTPPAFDAPLGGPRQNIAVIFGVEKLDCKEILKICLFILTESTNVTDGQTDKHTHTHTQRQTDGHRTTA